ncbi:hypothetical protein LCGC14_1449420 [marine sediment metagenome]|uniref:Uncharacterized protein n=2 Tax=root TaxID=1 RepID=A0A831QPP9_9FLAO|nr:hypothetical protein [Pricia antarctica]
MDFTRLNADRLFSDAHKLDYTSQISLHPQYREFLNFFSGKDVIDYNDLVVGAHMVYGRMPTMLRLNLGNADDVLLLLNRIKNGAELTIENLKMMNNSMVGPSKMLHFLDPERFAIWDSRIFRYVAGAGKPTHIGKAVNYFEYLHHVNGLVDGIAFLKVHTFVQGRMGVTHDRLRSLEIVMFETDKQVR